MDDLVGKLKKFFTKLFTDLFVEKDGDMNRENAAFLAAFLAFMVSSWHSGNSDGHWNPLAYGFGMGAILVAGGAATGAKRKAEWALRRIEARVTELEKQLNLDSGSVKGRDKHAAKT